MDFSKELIIDVLTDSFLENKSVNFIIKKDKNKRKRVEALMQYSYKYAEAADALNPHIMGSTPLQYNMQITAWFTCSARFAL